MKNAAMTSFMITVRDFRLLFHMMKTRIIGCIPFGFLHRKFTKKLLKVGKKRTQITQDESNLINQM